MSAERRSIGAGIVTAAAFVFLFAPLVVVIVFSFQSSASLTLPLTGPSVAWYRRVFGDPDFQQALEHSAEIGAIMAVSTLVVGTSAAYGVTRSTLRIRSALASLLTAPITLPALFLGVMLVSLFNQISLRLSLVTVGLAHFVWTFPVFFLLARVALDRMDRALEEVAADLGARPLRSFWRVTWPQVRPLLVGASALSFAFSFDEFIATSFVAGPQQTVPLLVYGKIRRTIDPTINVISTVLMAMMLALWLGAFLYAISRRRLRFQPSAASGAA